MSRGYAESWVFPENNFTGTASAGRSAAAGIDRHFLERKTMRLDVFLTTQGIYSSRTRAARAIGEGLVSVDGKTETKGAREVDGSEQIVCLPDPVGYVSRGALKLEFALRHFGIDVSGLRAIDVGASTGGFTEVLLANGAASVTAVDVGSGQLHPRIAADGRVTNLEKTNIRDLEPENAGLFGVLTCDCSFISLKTVLPCCARLMEPGATGIFLIKPQFEVGKGNLGKGGIVKDRKLREAAVAEVVEAAEKAGLLKTGGPVESPVKGGDGNAEYLAVFRRKGGP